MITGVISGHFTDRVWSRPTLSFTETQFLPRASIWSDNGKEKLPLNRQKPDSWWVMRPVEREREREIKIKKYDYDNNQ